MPRYSNRALEHKFWPRSIAIMPEQSNKPFKHDKFKYSNTHVHTCTYTCTYIWELTEENNNTEQDGHQSSGCEAIWEGKDLGVTCLHVSTAVTSTHAHNQCTGAALDGVVIVWDHDRQEVHTHLTPAETSPPCQDIGSVIWGEMQMGEACKWWDVSVSQMIAQERIWNLISFYQYLVTGNS